MRRTHGVTRLHLAAWMILACATSCTNPWSPENRPPPRDPRTWTVHARSDSWSREEWICAWQGDGGEWSVALESGAVVARPRPPRDPYRIFDAEGKLLPFPVADSRGPGPSQYTRDFIQVEDGFLAGYDYGEFGGGVWWFSPDGTQMYEVVGGPEVLGGNPIGFHPLGENVAVVFGLKHMMGWGSISELGRDPSSGRWQVRSLLDLSSPAEFSLPDPAGGFFVLTGFGLLHYDRSGVQQLVGSWGSYEWRFSDLSKLPPYGSLYPNSMVRASDGSFFVGMRYAVVEFARTDSGYTEVWRVPPSCSKLTSTWWRHACGCAA